MGRLCSLSDPSALARRSNGQFSSGGYARKMLSRTWADN